MNGVNPPEPEQFPSGRNVRLLRRRVRPRVPLRNRVAAEKLRKGVFLQRAISFAVFFLSFQLLTVTTYRRRFSSSWPTFSMGWMATRRA
jgi:hypothetical protein